MSMDITGEALIAAPQQRVWQALNDAAVLQASISGCQQLEKLSDTEFSAIVTTRVGPITATFRGGLTLSELDAPNGYVLTGRGQGGAAGFASMRARVTLEPQGGQTLLRYTAQAEIGGKLASVGSRLVQSVARRNADDFFAAFARQLDPSAAAAAVAPAPAGPATQPAEVLPRPLVAAAAPALAGGGLGAPVPAWLVVFGSGLGTALGWALGRLAG